MHLICAWPLLAAMLQAPAAQAPTTPPPGAMHIVVRGEFHYLASSRTSENEFWAGGGRLWRKRGAQIGEVTRPPATAPTAPEDLHTAGFDYEPEFFWKVTETSETRTLHGRSCRLTTAAGTAAYTQTELRLWLCPAQGDETGVSRAVVEAGAGRYPGIAEFVTREMAHRSGSVLLAAEETTEPAIAPVMVRKAEVIKLDTAAEPAAK